ncbi:helix-turn-helix domain-containing protein [Qipengyuania marisflavi]|uniref:AraC family transcriptional regulator n=1 Tax=Qipengyuania marisflavi TaxID=2486356 RepID=A0A5S3P501_9SPHN|nr:helix-turn-helix domain-containing protein [Qipengyuania marisflavi]TMM48087.1 AraC family transcriptional regulator [Qipengyuania marisflavi]
MSRPQPDDCVTLRFFLPPEQLKPFITTLYYMEVSGEAANPIEDWLHPEWANLRIFNRRSVEAAIGTQPVAMMPRAVAAGPTSYATLFRTSNVKSWGIGLLPLGWARFVGASAKDYADRLCNAESDPAMARLGPLARRLHAPGRTVAEDRDTIVAYLTRLLEDPPPRRETELVRLQAALVDPAIKDVAGLAAAVATTPRTLERFCASAFGFTPQMLLRRQRFLRSLAHFMLDPSLKWIETLDTHYHDQAHFVRDFKRFMTMTPSEYAALPHPVMMAAAQVRKSVAGEAVQGLHRPARPA